MPGVAAALFDPTPPHSAPHDERGTGKGLAPPESPPRDPDPDRALALKLQAQFEREGTQPVREGIAKQLAIRAQARLDAEA